MKIYIYTQESTIEYDIKEQDSTTVAEALSKGAVLVTTSDNSELLLNSNNIVAIEFVTARSTPPLRAEANA